MANWKFTLQDKTLAEAALGVPISLDIGVGELKFVINKSQRPRGEVFLQIWPIDMEARPS